MKYLKVFSFLFIASLVLLGAAQPALACDTAVTTPALTSAQTV